MYTPTPQAHFKPTTAHNPLRHRKWLWMLSCFVMLAWSGGVGVSGCAPAPPEPNEHLSGGDTTVTDITRNAFARTARNMPKEWQADFFVGNSFFNSNWVIAPSSTAKRDGLGPVFNARSCSSCHFKDGRGRPPIEKDEAILSILIRLSIPGKGPHGGPLGDPNYGTQFNPKSILGVKAEGNVTITYTEIKGSFADGTPYTLRKPVLTFTDLAYGPLHTNIMTSARVAPAVFGLGLLEQIPEDTILKKADPDDADGDGISGRPNRVWDIRKKAMVLGRFGWKANEPNLEQQNAGAFLGDIGITSPLFPKENCTSSQKECLSAPTGGSPEVPQEKIDQITLYVRSLAVPARRNWDDAAVLRGKQLFGQAGCAKCHTPKMKTGNNPKLPSLSNQTIWPYTDLLLHDMGKGLADGRPDFAASGSEWRTPPLWGIGLVKTVNRHTLFLHDGRARNLQEAILWHGGEGKGSQEAFVRMPKEDRKALIAFLESL